jgi:hypothetical protein
VAGANEFSMSQQTDIFDYLSNYRIYNCIIVSPLHYIIDNEYSKPKIILDADAGPQLGVYTWFPYQSSDHCTEVNDITLLDSWVVSAQGHFKKNTDLFPIKISKSFNGCPMKTVARSSYWSLNTREINVQLSNGSVGWTAEGRDVDLLRVVLQQMNMTFVFVPTPEGFEMETGLVQNLTKAMIAKEAYIALGDMGNHFLLESYFDSTSTYNIFSVRWYVPCSIKYPRWSSFFRILSLELWLILILVIVIASILTTLVGRYTCMFEWQGYKTMSSSFTNILAVILGVSVSTMPSAPSLRSLFLAWVFFSLAFSTVIQAFLTTFLIDSGYIKPIQNVDELYASGIKLAYSPDYDFIFESGDKTEVSKLQRNFANCTDYLSCAKWAMYHRNVSVLISDILAEINYSVGDFLGDNSEPLVCRLDDGVVFSSGLTMIMIHGDPLMRRFSEILDRVFEAGIYTHLDSESIGLFQTIFREKGHVHQLDEYYSFNLYHMQPAFYLLLLGWCLSAICFIVEVLFNRILVQTTSNL